MKPFGVSILALATRCIGGLERARYENQWGVSVVEYPPMGTQKRTMRLPGPDPEAFKWAMIAAVIAMVITAGVVRFGPERPVTGADHQRFEQTLRGSSGN
jgi:hypothetical protein